MRYICKGWGDQRIDEREATSIQDSWRNNRCVGVTGWVAWCRGREGKKHGFDTMTPVGFSHHGATLMIECVR